MAREKSQEVLELAAALPEQVRARAPRVHCLTNHAAAGISANMLLAVGAIPSLTDHPDELEDFIAGADALMVNLGTPDAARVAAVSRAIDFAQRIGCPWVLDPVMCERGRARLAWARECLSRTPDLVRLNAPEAAALGLDLSGNEVRTRAIALTGATDRIVTADHDEVRVGNGHPLMAKVTAIGCGLSAVLAAFISTAEDSFIGATAGLVTFGVAGEIAGQKANGPGSFPAALLDALHSLDGEQILRKGHLSCAP